MKDGRTQLAHKPSTRWLWRRGALVGVTVQDAHDGDTTMMVETLITAAELFERLLHKRGARLERPHAHLYETGRLRPLYLRCHANILKRLLVDVSRLNLGLLMRHLTGIGTPRSLQGRVYAPVDALIRGLTRLWRPRTPFFAAHSTGPVGTDVVWSYDTPSSTRSVCTKGKRSCHGQLAHGNRTGYDPVR